MIEIRFRYECDFPGCGVAEHQAHKIGFEGAYETPRPGKPFSWATAEGYIYCPAHQIKVVPAKKQYADGNGAACCK